MYIPTWIMFILVFACGWCAGIMGTFRDINKNPKRFYERHIKPMIADQEYNENEEKVKGL